VYQRTYFHASSSVMMRVGLLMEWMDIEKLIERRYVDLFFIFLYYIYQLIDHLLDR